jgi:hypothetical protein
MANTGYLTFPLETDSDTLVQNALTNLMFSIPGWLPKEGHLEVQIIEVLGRMTSETAAVAAQVPPGIFRYFGKSIIGIPAIEAAPATVASTWTLRDTAGHTIPAGTDVYYPIDGVTQVGFRVQSDVVVAPGSSTTSTGEVVLVATTPGTAANGLTSATVNLIDSLAWVSSIVTEATTSGGVEAETDSAYLDRLRAELRLLTPRPILPNDFALLAERIAGVGRATAIDGYDIGTNEKQRITITGSPTGGTFTITYSGQTTSAITYNANAFAIQTALQALSNVGSGNVTVTGGPLPGTQATVEFVGTLATTNVALMTSTSSLTGGTSPAISIITTQTGVAPSSGNARTITVAVAAADGTALNTTIKNQVAAYLQALREVNFLIYVIDPTYTTVNVTASVKALAGYDTASIESACEDALTAYLSPTTWDWSSTVYRNELIALLSNITGVDRVISITTPASDLSLGGVAALPLAGTMDVAVS